MTDQEIKSLIETTIESAILEHETKFHKREEETEAIKEARQYSVEQPQKEEFWGRK